MNEEKIKILGFVGPSGCGKDTAARILSEHSSNKYHYVKLCTTRPQRNEEDNGYFFLTPEEFLQQILNGRMLNAQEFRGWYYGLNDDGLDKNKINVLPMSNEMVKQMTEENRDEYSLKIVYIHTFDKKRLLHILEREDKPDCQEICRRFLTDFNDYEHNEELLSCCNKVIENKYNHDFYLDCVLAAEACFEGD
jgi:guanylate kinase